LTFPTAAPYLTARRLYIQIYRRMDKWTIAKRNAGGLDNRLSLIRPDWENHENLSQADWVGKVLALRSEGCCVQRIEEILTSGRIENQVIRDRWALGEDMDPQWGEDDRARAESILWNSRILALGSEGYPLKRIEEILTLGRIEDQMIRDKWVLGDGNEPKWDKDMKTRAKDIFWGFGKVTIQLLYQGSGSPGDKGMRVERISEKIKADSGFYYA
jgi:DNA-binding transcriptional MerR regulator